MCSPYHPEFAGLDEDVVDTTGGPTARFYLTGQILPYFERMAKFYLIAAQLALLSEVRTSPFSGFLGMFGSMRLFLAFSFLV